MISENVNEIKLPTVFDVNKHIVETVHSDDTSQHKTYKNIIVKAFSESKNDTLDKVCLEIANRIKKSIWPREKPNRSMLCAIIPKASHSLDKKTKAQYGTYYEYALKSKFIIAVKYGSSEDETKLEETKVVSERLRELAIGFAQSSVK